MKKLLIAITVLLIGLNTFAQTGPDILVKTTGEEMKGRVVKVTDTEVTFVYAGETAEYVVKKSEISKIVHSSGRTENFGTSSSSGNMRNDALEMTPRPSDHHNKIAILPFSYLIDNQPGADQLAIKAQQDTYAFLSKHSAGYTLLDPRTTNSLLAKGGVTRDRMMNFTMKEICDILGVEYVLEGTVTQNKGYQTSSTFSTDNTKIKRDDNNNVKGISGSDSSYGNSVQRYDVSVGLNIYMDNNVSIFNQSHKAFLSNTDGSYSDPLEYLLKRCPLYRK
jgi:TolB-like protein